MEICDGDLVRRARAGDAAAFRLLVERHSPSARVRAARLCGRAHDVDDIVQEAFLQAFLALDRLRDPDRFGAWLAGIIRNVHHAAGRQEPLMLLAEWPEGLHPVSAQGLPSADDLDRAEALRAAVAELPDGQRRAVELYYYAGLPAGQIAGSSGAVKASLHRARGRLRAHITAHRPDLIPVSRRAAMTNVRIACAEPHMGTRLDGSPAIGHILVVLADDRGHRAMGLWLRTRQGMALWRILGRLPRDGDGQPAPDASAADLPAREYSPEDLAGQLLAAAGGSVTGVDIDELGPNVLAARIGVAGPAGARQVTAPAGSALALAAVLQVPVRVPDALMDRLAIPVTGNDLLGPFVARTPPHPSGPRSGPRNLDFAGGLDGWTIGGSSRAEVTGAHWNDYAVAAAHGAATLSAAVPQPYGDVFLGQQWLADDYRSATVTLRAEVRSQDVGDRAELSLDIVSQPQRHSQDRVMHAPPGDQPQPVQRVDRDRQHLSEAITGTRDWTRYQITGRVPGDAEHLGFELTLAGPGSVWLRNVDLARTS
ncbi:MAG TPA: sigma-70 family RNA polymerase sigma factor [Streptosporangiaceae bacterium]